MQSNKNLVRTILFVCFSAVLILHSFITGSYIDPYETQKFYTAWANGLSGLNLTNSVLTEQIYIISKESIKAPEIVAHISGLFLSKIFGVNLLHVLKFLLLATFVFSMDMTNKNFRSQVAILSFMFFLSFYIFTLNNITLRLCIGAIFFVLSFRFAKFKSQFLSGITMGLAVSAHLSLLLLLPALFLTSRGSNVNPLNFLFNGLLGRFALGFLLVFFSNLAFYLLMQNNDILFLLLGSKLQQANILSLPLVLGIMIFGIFYYFLISNKLVNDILLVIFTLLVFSVIGTSRTVMLFAILSYVIVFFNPEMFETVFSKKYKFGSIPAYFFIVFLVYDFYKSLGFFFFSSI